MWPVVTSKAMENPTAITTPSGENVPMPNPPISEQSVTVQIQSATVPSAVPATAAAHHGYLLVVAVVVAVASQHNIMIDGCPLTILLYCVVSLQSTNCSSSSSSTAEACPRTESRGCTTLSRPGKVPMLPPPVIQHMWLCGGFMLSRPPPLILPSLTDSHLPLSMPPSMLSPLSYLSIFQVKMEFSDKPQIYNEFLDIMKNFKAQS